MSLLSLLVLYLVPSINGEVMRAFLKHTSAKGTENHHNVNVTHAKLPHLPAVHGFMGTQATYRFLSVVKQTAWLVGEPKHGMWRYQQNGMIREYRKRGRMGIRKEVDPNDPNLSQVHQDIIRDNYGSFLPGEGYDGYKYPDQRISTGDGTYDKKKDYLNFIDLTIYHPKYKGKYEKHVPIDLPAYFCTVSQANFPHAHNAWRYLVAQKNADKLGPLAKRAGFDIKEQFLHVARFEFIHDANIWINIGSEDGLDPVTGKPNPNHTQSINYVKMSHTKMKHEAYLVERLFFNTPYLFVMVVIDNVAGPSKHSYIRPDGPYWTELQKRTSATFNHNPLHKLHVFAEDWPTKGAQTAQVGRGMPLYGVQNPERVANGLYGGACPSRGGDWGRYPWGNSGAAYPTTYEETTPLCDALAMDIKLTHNLWVDTWNDASVGLANAGYGVLKMPYYVDRNIYGRYTDPYLLKINASNPSTVDFTSDGKMVANGVKPKPNQTSINMRYMHVGTLINYTPVKGLKLPASSCPTAAPTAVASATIPKLQPGPEPYNTPTTIKPAPACPPAKTSPPAEKCPPLQKCSVLSRQETYSTEILVTTCVSLAVLVILLLLVIIMLYLKANANQERFVSGNQERFVSGKANAGADA